MATLGCGHVSRNTRGRPFAKYTRTSQRDFLQLVLASLAPIVTRLTFTLHHHCMTYGTSTYEPKIPFVFLSTSLVKLFMLRLKLFMLWKTEKKTNHYKCITLTQPFMPTREFPLWLLNCNNSATTIILKINIENKSLNHIYAK
jgi:hypothetical protein